MIWSSNDRLWDRPLQREGEPLHVGVEPFTTELWRQLQHDDDLSWSMAVHPYDPGNPMDGSEWPASAGAAPGTPPTNPPRAYTFATLGRVDEYVAAQVQAVRGLDPEGPEGLLFRHQFASEQGWPFPACCADRVRGRNICYAHALAVDAASRLVGVTHNDFQDAAGATQGGRYV
jgi:hypothetical protein